MQKNNNIFNSFKWSYLSYIVPNLLLPIFTVFIARTLSPSDYGIFSMNLIFVGAFNTIQALGLREFIIRENDFNELKKSTLFYLSVLLGILSYIAILIIAPLVSIFFNEEIIKQTLPVLGVTLIFNSLGVIHFSFLEKYFQFKKIFFIQILPLICVIVVTLPLALNGFGYKALIYGELAKSLSLMVSYLFYHKWIPKPVFDLNYFKEAISFGRWISLERILEYSLANLDRLFLGFFFSSSVLGLYALSRQIVNILFGFLSGGIIPVLLPLLSSVSHSKSIMLKTIKDIFENIIFLNISLVFFIAIASVSMFELVLPNWDNIGFYILVLSLGEVAVRSINFSRDIYKIHNKPKIYPQSLLINVFFAITAYAFSMKWIGLIGFLFIRIINDYLYLAIQYSAVKKIIDVSQFGLLAQIIKGLFVNGMTFLICYYIFTSIENNFDIYIYISIQILLSILLFIIFQYLLNRRIFIIFYNNVLKLLRS